MSDDIIPPAARVPTRTDSLMTDNDREWFTRLLKDQEDRNVERFEKIDRKIEKLSARTSLADQENTAAINRILLDPAREAGREGSEASGKKWAAIQALIALAATIITSLIARQEQPPATPADRHSPTIQQAAGH